MYQPIIGGVGALFLHFIADNLQLIFRCTAAGYNVGILNIPVLIIKTCHIVAVGSAGCLVAHRHTAGFHRIRSGYCLHINVPVEFYADFCIVTGLSNLRRNITIAVDGDFRA